MDATFVSRAQVVSMLRSRGKTARAEWFERELPDIVDIAKNRSLLTTLGVDPADLRPVERIAGTRDPSAHPEPLALIDG